MKIEKITVHAGRTFNHPYEQFSNLRPGLSIEAFLQTDDDPEESIKELQAKAEKMIEDHKTHMLRSLTTLYELNEAQRTITNLERQIKDSQETLDRAREKVSEFDPGQNFLA